MLPVMLFASPRREGLFLGHTMLSKHEISYLSYSTCAMFCPIQMLFLTLYSNGHVLLLPIADVLSEYIGYFFLEKKLCKAIFARVVEN